MWFAKRMYSLMKPAIFKSSQVLEKHQLFINSELIKIYLFIKGDFITNFIM